MSHQNNVLKQKTSLFYIPMGEKKCVIQELFKCVHTQAQPHTQTVIDNNNTYEPGMPVKQHKEPPMMTYVQHKLNKMQIQCPPVHTASVRTIIQEHQHS